MNIESLFQAQRKQSWKQRQTSASERTDHLERLSLKIRSSQNEICAALQEDFGKSEHESLMTEIYPVLQEIQHTKRNLKKWMRPQKVATPWSLFGTKSSIVSDPKGVVLIIAPWNYPFHLAMLPVVSAIAAGNCVILKPSELTPRTSHLLSSLLTELFPTNLVAVLQGDKILSQQLLSLPFDHIFFTGSTTVGKVVMTAASPHLASLTLELGGKSPTMIDDTADLDLAAEKILWGKFVNAGQTCIAPDYVLVQTSIQKALVRKLKEKLESFSQNLQQDHARIISSQHLQRLNHLFSEAMAQNATLITGGQFDFQKLTMSPTLLEKVPEDCALMKEEIFGPLLPILGFSQIKEAIQFINSRPKPLALYVFSKSQENIRRILNETSAGGVTINDTLLHFANHHLPFGGVGESGLGHYHGRFGFKTFSHEKAVLRQSWFGRFFRVLYPPYSPWKLKLVRWLIRWG